jgi:hypothetical protein
MGECGQAAAISVERQSLTPRSGATRSHDGFHTAYAAD